MKRTTILGICMTALVAFAVWAPNVLANSTFDGCTSCHQGQGNVFIFPGATHDLHSKDKGYSCSTCHDGGNGSDPVITSSCANCHSSGGEGLRSIHIDNSFSSCGSNTVGCHYSPPPPACNDNDNDGYGNPGDSSCANGSAADCNDNNAAINPGADENCTDKIDNDCNNLVDAQDPDAVNCPTVCVDNDGDTYYTNGGTCGQIDCDDTDANVNPGASELCDDIIDNDCDGQADCDDGACLGDSACLAEFCTAYEDRRSCKADSRCSWSGKLKACTEPVVYTESDCLDAGGRYNKKKRSCTIR